MLVRIGNLDIWAIEGSDGKVKIRLLITQITVPPAEGGATVDANELRVAIDALTKVAGGKPGF